MVNSKAKELSVQLKGGLIYKTEGLAQINQDHVQYIRNLDSSALIELSQKAQDSISLYEAFCKTIIDLTKQTQTTLQTYEQSNETLHYIKTLIEHPVSEAEAVCASLGARKPEVRSTAKWGELRNYGVKYNITIISAGLYYDQTTQTIRFVSDKTSAKKPGMFDKITYGGSYTGRSIGDTWESKHIKNEALSYPFIYRNPKNDFSLHIADIKQMETKQLIICERLNIPKSVSNPSQNKLLQMAAATCKRDMNNLKRTTEFAIKELKAVTTLNFSLINEPPMWNSYFPEIINLDTNETSRFKRSFHDLTEEQKKAWEDHAQLHSPLMNHMNKGYLRRQKKKKCLKKQNQTDVDIITSMINYENLIIHTPFHLKTIPDLVVALHAFWTVLHKSKQTTDNFPNWMTNQAYKEPIYANFRKNPSFYKLQKRFISEIENFEIKLSTSNITDEEYLDTLTKIDSYVSFPNTNPQFKQLTIHGLDYSFENLTVPNNKRPKRALPAVLIGIAAGATIGVLSSQANNLKKAQDFSPDGQTMALYKSFAKQINDLQINQNEVTSTIRMVYEKIKIFEQQIIGSFEGAQANTMELDLKSLIRHQQAIVQITMLKYNQILQAASFGKTSPYVLTKGELKELGITSMQQDGIIISDNPDDVICYTSITNNTIQFILQVPIKDPSKEFSLFTITPIPTFADNSTFMPQLDSNHIAINSIGDKYTILNDLELNRCLDTPPDCKSTKPIAPISDRTSCAALTYTSDSQQCPYKNTGMKPTTFVRFFDVNMFYSAPQEQKIYIQCAKTPTHPNIRSEVITIQGIGVNTVHHSCDITLPDGSTHRTPKIPSIFHIQNNLFSEVKNIPQPPPEAIYITNQRIFTDFDLKDSEVTDFTDMIMNSFHPARSLSTIIITLTIIVSLIIVLLFTCKYTPWIYEKPAQLFQELQEKIYNRGLPPTHKRNEQMQEWFPEETPMRSIIRQRPTTMNQDEELTLDLTVISPQQPYNFSQVQSSPPSPSLIQPYDDRYQSTRPKLPRHHLNLQGLEINKPNM